MGNPSSKVIRVAASDFGVMPERFDHDAVEVCKTLQAAGFEAYIVGGCVRDILLGLDPKDADVSTSATPQEIKPLFKRCLLIGKRFRLAHVYFGRHLIEVATFRAGHNDDSDQGKTDESGMVIRDNVFGTVEEDVLRRDFTINSLLYDPVKHEFIDYTGGLEDLKKKKLRSLGNPLVRFQEDPVRILRAIRFVAKCDLEMPDAIHQAIYAHQNLLEQVSKSRLFEEYKKLFLTGSSIKVTELLRKFNCFTLLFPYTEPWLDDRDTGDFLQQALLNTDERSASGKTLHPAFLISVFLWPALCEKNLKLSKKDAKKPPSVCFHESMENTLNSQRIALSIPKRISMVIRDIWSMQYKLEKRRPRTLFPCLEHPRFRAAYDFLLLRAKMDGIDHEITQWWTDIQTFSNAEKKQAIQALKKSKKRA